MSENLREKVVRYLTYLVLLLIVVGGAVMMYPDYRRSESLKRQNAELQEQIESRKREIERLIENQRRFKTDADFVEKIARQNHRVLPGELVFIFNDKD
ncbi:MAG: septum formation initiator family protein [Kiritimatiellae bacterium]|nr:septum formation initiator family protein [Kiritimatiellia bacterium]